MSSGSTFSVFGADIKIKGNVSASADLHIDGHIEGDINCATLVQGEASEITGAITASGARLSGTVRGTVHAGDLVVSRTARIHGDIHYDTITIEQGALVDGRLAQRQAASVIAIEGDARVVKG
ncbi:polymer-forming cytoskeletal protein [Novosphingobium sp. FSY-8]|uniref:Polymer-forming cytoskeletal protein n=1 Tax=Novosphingobium ovatum TaxID=1908523 RepID=A0ABW9XHA8_9SPHN|nr:polymer-forming cytoskeletal protein [Novosphingobium ovatum]NBC37941.1 polymer-forming cytoskeletal protein [Novosphingobium ovatum]